MQRKLLLKRGVDAAGSESEGERERERCAASCAQRKESYVWEFCCVERGRRDDVFAEGGRRAMWGVPTA
jgi:hypothetical protein